MPLVIKYLTVKFNEYKCRIMAKLDNYNGESKIKYSI